MPRIPSHPFDADELAADLYPVLAIAVAEADRRGENRYVVHRRGEFHIQPDPPVEVGFCLVCAAGEQPLLARTVEGGALELVERPGSPAVEEGIRAAVELRDHAA